MTLIIDSHSRIANLRGTLGRREEGIGLWREQLIGLIILPKILGDLGRVTGVEVEVWGCSGVLEVTRIGDKRCDEDTECI